MIVGIFIDTSTLVYLWYNKNEYDLAKKFSKESKDYTFFVTPYMLLEFAYALLRNEVAEAIIKNNIKPVYWVLRYWNQAYILFDELFSFDEKLFKKILNKVDKATFKLIEDLSLTINPFTETEEELIIQSIIGMLVTIGLHVEDAFNLAMFLMLEEPEPRIVVTNDEGLYRISKRLIDIEDEEKIIPISKEEYIEIKLKEVYKWDNFKRKYILK